MPIPPRLARSQAAEAFAEAVALRIAGRTHLRQDQADKSLPMFAAARDIFHHLGESAQVAWTLHLEGLALRQLGRAAEYRERFSQARQMLGAGNGAADNHLTANLNRMATLHADMDNNSTP